MKRWIGFLFVLACLAQWAVPVQMLAKRELALRRGDAYHFRTMPVDPYDAFRGRYVALRFELGTVTNLVVSTNLEYGVRLYAGLGRDEQGFATFTALHEKKPAGEPSIPVTLDYVNEGEVHLTLPFDRFYLEESLAPKAEAAYASAVRTNAMETYAVVRVYRHFPVLENLVVNGQPVHQIATDDP